MKNSTMLTLSEIEQLDAYWRASNYLCAGMIHLRENPLLRVPLSVSHLKKRLLGHWGSSPGQTFIWTHLNRAIAKYDLDMLYISGPGHGAPAVIAHAWLEGTMSQVYPDMPLNEHGMLELFRSFSFPGRLGSHCTPEIPGSMHEGGELGYSLSHAFGAAFDNPDLVVAAIVGDGEAETGPLATAWHSNKFLNPARDGAVLPILHLNGYKIANPTVLSRISGEELQHLFKGYGWTPVFVEGDDPKVMHQAMAKALDDCLEQIRQIQRQARASATGTSDRPRWPMIVLRTPKGWTGPKASHGHAIEGYWRAHQVPLPNVRTDPQELHLLEQWMRSYEPESLFDDTGALDTRWRALIPPPERRMSASPHANGGRLRVPLNLPAYQDYAIAIGAPGLVNASPTATAGLYLREVMRRNPTNFRLFSPDENASNKLHDVYAVTGKTWMANRLPVDADEGHLATDGRVMEMLSEHTLEGWLEGYLLTGRHGLLNTYEAFAHIIDSMVNQHAKWLEKSREALQWRAPVPSLNILLSSLVWRQDHNGFTHQDPGFLDVITNKSGDVTRIYLPPDGNCLLSVMDHCLRSSNYVNVIVSDKQPHLVYLNAEQAALHCAKGVGIWPWASSDAGQEPDVVMACAGDIITQEALGAVALLRDRVADLKVRFVNVVDLYRLPPADRHPHGLNDDDFDALFTRDKPVIFSFHGYPWLIHKLVYRRHNHANFHVRGYREKGNINTPLELAILNGVDRYSLAIDMLDHVPRLSGRTAHLKEWLKERRLDGVNYAHTEGTDRPEISGWKWPENTF